MRDPKLSRRAALRLLSAAPVVTVVLTGCGKKTEPDSCNDVSALDEAQKAARGALQYTDKTPQPDKHCSVCNFWQAPSDPAQCGACTLVKGPIHPKGYCTAFAPKAAS